MTFALASALSLLATLALDPSPEAAPEPPKAEAPAAAKASITYTIDNADTLLYVVLDAPEDSKAHDHVVKADQVSGSVLWGEADKEISVQFPVSALAPDLDEMRAMVGFEDTLKAKHQAKVKQHLLADSQLDGEQFDTIRFTSRAITQSAAGWRVQGDMEIHGQVQQVETLLTVKEANGVFIGTGSFQITGSDFGFAPYSKGPYFNADTMTVHVKLAAQS